jgi:DNA-binding HxlR family transcriptional regulator
MAGQRNTLEVPPCGCGTAAAGDPSTCYCSVEDLLRVIRRRYSLALLNAIHLRQPARYRDLATVLSAASTSTLSETLAALEAARLIVRRTSELVPTATYSLTQSGAKLLGRLKPLLDDVR